MVQFFQKIKNLFLDIIFPIRCLGCKKYDVWLCDECLNKIEIADVFICPKCEEKSLRGETHVRCQKQSFLNGLIIAVDWQNEIVRKLIHSFKYNFAQDLKYCLSKIIIKKIYKINNLFQPCHPDECRFASGKSNRDLVSGSRVKHGMTKKEHGMTKKEHGMTDVKVLDNIKNYFDYIIPVPLHKIRQHWRGFNQAELLADEISKEIKIPVLNNIIFRIKNTKSQVKKGKKEKRQINIQGAFQVNDKYKNLVFVQNSPFCHPDDITCHPAVLRDLVSGFRVTRPNDCRRPVGREHGMTKIEHGMTDINLENKKILLVDDVFTTGSTMQEVAKVLKQASAGEVWGLVITKG